LLLEEYVLAVVAVSSIDALVASDPAALDDAELRELLRDLQRARAMVDATEAAAIVEFDSRGLFTSDGSANTPSWLAHHTGEARAVAGSRFQQAKLLRRFPVLHDALRDGAITAPHVRVFGSAYNVRTAFALHRDEAMLVDVARELDADGFAIAMAKWRELNDERDPDDQDPSELHLSPMLAGRGRLDGQLELHDRVVVQAELEVLCDELWRADQRTGTTRTRPQRMAAALVEMARRSSASGDRDDDPDTITTTRRTPARPRIVAVVDVDRLAGDRTRPVATLDDGAIVPDQLLQEWMCDSLIGRVVMKGKSIPFDLGTLTYTATDAQRRMLLARDGGCVIPGCHRKGRWCHAHHVVPWPEGPTDIDNLCFACSHHHHEIHAGRILLKPGDAAGTWIITDAYGTPLLSRPPPDLRC
jgi:hypothetical protein